MVSKFCSASCILLATLTARAQDMPLAEILPAGENWKAVPGSYGYSTGLRMNAAGDVITFDSTGKAESRILPDNKIESVTGNEGDLAPTTIRLGIDKTIRFDFQKRTTADPITPLLQDKKPYTIRAQGRPVLALSPDLNTLFIADSGSRDVWVYRTGRDDRFTGGERYISLRVRHHGDPSGACAFSFDTARRIYIAMKDGVQVFDPTGRLCGLILKPGPGTIRGMAFGGPERTYLYLLCGDKIYYRRLSTPGAFPTFKTLAKQ